MRIYTILKSIINKVMSAHSSLKQKQDKTWTKLGEIKGTIKYSLSEYEEMSVYVRFGGVQVGQLIPVSMIPISGTITLYVGYYNNVIYVDLSKASAKITKQPAGYTGTLVIYAR